MAMKRILLAATALFLLSGCAGNTTFVYKPSAPLADGRNLPVKVAILPFKDATEDFTKRGSELFDQDNLMYNLAKAGVGAMITALTPELWAKALADDMAASGDFQTVTFLFSPEVKDEDFIIEGAVNKAYLSGVWARPNEFALSLRALRRTDNRQSWEKEVVRAWKTPGPAILYDGCKMGPQCMVDRSHADINGVMQSMFAEARTDLVRTLEPLSGGQVRTDASMPSAAPAPPPESVDETIENILKAR